MVASSATVVVSSVLLPHALVYHRSAPLPQLLAVSSFRRLSLSASPGRTTHLVTHADASADAGEPEPEAEPVAASADAEEGEAEGAITVAEGDEEEDEPAPPSKPLVKFDEIIGILNKQFIEEAEKVKTVPDLRPGDIIKLRMQRPNKRRLSLFKGIIIAKHKSDVHTTICVRRIIAGVGVEITFPVDVATEGLLKVRWTYPFGVDLVWHGSRSKLPFLNSLKMKMSILLGVAQMNLGIAISYFNAKFFSNSLNVWYQFIPQLIFLNNLFGYLSLIIIIKWCTGSTVDLYHVDIYVPQSNR